MVDNKSYFVTFKQDNKIFSLHTLLDESDFAPENLGFIFEKICNRCSTNQFAGQLALHISTLHHTIQQSIVRFLLDTLITLGKYSEFTDRRNEKAISICHRLTEMKKAGELDLPLI